MNKTPGLVAVLIAFSISIHLLPFIVHDSPHPLGYDTGFYRRYVINPLISLPGPAVPGLGSDALMPRLFLGVLRLTGLPTDIILYGSYIVLFTLQAVGLFFLTRHYFGDSAGLLAALFLIISPVQYASYWFMLFKNAFALPLMLAAFLFLERKSSLSIPFGILIALSHHTSSIIFLLTLGISAAFGRDNRKLILRVLTITFLTFFYLHYSSFKDYLNSPVAVFMDAREYLWLSLPLLIFAGLGLKKFAFENPRSIMVAFFAAAAAFPLLRLPFYERIFIFSDIGVIMAASLGFKEAVERIFNRRELAARIAYAAVVLVSLSWLSINTYGRIQNLRPLVSKQDIEALGDISLKVPSDAAILTSTPLAPWVHGWSRNEVLAPGLLHDTHSAKDWVEFNSGSPEQKIDFLKEFPRPLYVFLASPEKDIFLNNFRGCFSEKSEYLMEYAC